MIAEFVVRRGLLPIAVGWMIVAMPVFGQHANAGAKVPAFDVVSIKPTKGLVDMIVVDHVEMPSEN